MIRLLIADDFAIVREGLKRILARCEGFAEVDEASNGHEALEKARASRYDVILLDVDMPGLDGLSVLKQLKSEQPDVRVMGLSVHAEEEYGVRMLRAGAAGYLCKDRAVDELLEAVQRVAAGERYVTDRLAELLADGLCETSTTGPHAALTDREYQVLRGTGEGKSVTEIAAELYLSAKTISTYRARILQKLGMDRNAELIRYCHENKIVS